MLIGTNQILSKVGSFVVVSALPIEDAIKISDYSDKIEKPEYVKVSREISYSYDRMNWSEYETLTNTVFKNLDYSKKINLKFKYTVIYNPYNEFVEVKDVILNITYKIDKDKKRPPALLKADLGMFEFIVPEMQNYQQEFIETTANTEIAMNYLGNIISGTPCIYYRTLPDKDTVDVILNEYSIKGVVEKKEILVVIPEGNIPDDKPEFSMWGVGVKPFEIQISKAYWEQQFGAGTKPRDEDIVWIPLAKNMYYVKSNYLQSGIGEQEIYWALQLEIYDNNTAVKKPEGVEEEINKATLTVEDLFGEKQKAEIENASGKHQVKFNNIDTDKYRSFIHRDLLIVNDDGLSINKQQIFKNYYSFVNMDVGELAITYKDQVSFGKSIGLTAWLYINKDITEFQKIAVFGNITIGIEGLKLILKYRNINSNIEFDLSQFIQIEKWFAVCINISNEFNNTKIAVFDSLAETNTRQAISKKLHKSQQRLSPDTFTNQLLDVFSGDYRIANLRIWKQSVPDEYQQIAIISETVTKASGAWIIDNVDNIYTIGKLGEGKQM